MSTVFRCLRRKIEEQRLDKQFTTTFKLVVLQVKTPEGGILWIHKKGGLKKVEPSE